jgi:2,5-dioxopentanoate dehydrogenase
MAPNIIAHRQVLIAGRWQAESAPVSSFSAVNPQTGVESNERFPVSGVETLEAALVAGQQAARDLAGVEPARIAAFLERYATEIEARSAALVDAAHEETGLPKEPRLRNVELPRTTAQLRAAAAAARERSFSQPVIDTKNNIRSMFGALGGPVAVFGPNNFPFAFNAVSGGDFAAAVAAGNPVIAKAHPSHPTTTRLLAEAAVAALEATSLPAATLQLIYALPNELGLRLVSDPLVAASAFTGSRGAGLALKAAADRAGKPIYLELSSINPLFVLPGAITERGAAIAGELAGSCTMGAGQFCTKPGLSVIVASDAAETFVAELGAALGKAPPGTLLGPSSGDKIAEGIGVLREHGAVLVTGGNKLPGPRFTHENTLLRVSGDEFLAEPEALQTEAFGSVHLVVVAASASQLSEIADALDGNLTGTIYSHTGGDDDDLYRLVASHLRKKVGRLLNDKMPTGVAVSPAMNHGGPYPSTGHPGFTAVGIPASIRRFTALHCYDNVREPRLPPELRNHNALELWRSIDGKWTQADVS